MNLEARRLQGEEEEIDLSLTAPEEAVWTTGSEFASRVRTTCGLADSYGSFRLGIGGTIIIWFLILMALEIMG